jgi:hypothetical protein
MTSILTSRPKAILWYSPEETLVTAIEEAVARYIERFDEPPQIIISSLTHDADKVIIGEHTLQIVQGTVQPKHHIIAGSVEELTVKRELKPNISK